MLNRTLSAAGGAVREVRYDRHQTEVAEMGAGGGQRDALFKAI